MFSWFFLHNFFKQSVHLRFSGADWSASASAAFSYHWYEKAHVVYYMSTCHTNYQRHIKKLQFYFYNQKPADLEEEKKKRWKSLCFCGEAPLQSSLSYRLLLAVLYWSFKTRLEKCVFSLFFVCNMFLLVKFYVTGV